MSIQIWVILTIILTTIFNNISYSQPELAPEIRASIYKIDQPGVYSATGVLFNYKGNKFLITNKHVVEDTTKPNNVCDSIFIFYNKIMNNKEVLSTSTKIIAYLSGQNKRHYFLPKPNEYDLILISLGKNNTIDERADTVNLKPYSFYSRLILDKNKLNQVLDTTSIATAIGYPWKGVYFTNTFPEYRWGKIIEINENYLKTNIPVVRGNSGSVVLLNKNNKYYVVGILYAVYNNHSFAVPISKIKTHITKYFELADLKDN